MVVVIIVITVGPKLQDSSSLYAQGAITIQECECDHLHNQLTSTTVYPPACLRRKIYPHRGPRIQTIPLLRNYGRRDKQKQSTIRTALIRNQIIPSAVRKTVEQAAAIRHSFLRSIPLKPRCCCRRRRTLRVTLHTKKKLVFLSKGFEEVSAACLLSYHIWILGETVVFKIFMLANREANNFDNVSESSSSRSESIISWISLPENR